MQTWQMQLQQGFKTPESLLHYLNLSTTAIPHSVQTLYQAHQNFRTKVPLSFAQRMQKENWDDPLLKQVLPTAAEMLNNAVDFTVDPLDEKTYTILPGLIHKYTSRALITLTGSCAVNCRYCFRRHFDYKANTGRQNWDNIFNYLQGKPSIYEVILSGGDPLLLDDDILAQFLERLTTIKHIKLLRFHTRIPIVLPSRITTKFLTLLKTIPKKIVFVLHCNHPQEIDELLIQSLHTIQQAGFALLNQAVLLKGINDNIDTLEALSLRLFDAHMLPYYLHQLDLVKGAEHFAVSDQTALSLHRALQARLPGYLVPKLVKEVPGEKHKVALGI